MSLQEQIKQYIEEQKAGKLRILEHGFNDPEDLTDAINKMAIRIENIKKEMKGQ